MNFDFAKGAGTRPDRQADEAAESKALRDLSGRFSIEVSPKEALRPADDLRRLPVGTRTFIPRLPKGSFDETLAASVALRQAGLAPVPHVTARTIPDAATLEQWLQRFIREAGVTEILLIAGDKDRAVGQFSDTQSVLRSGVIEASGLQAISFAGHPEGHPNADAASLKRAIEFKNEFAERTGLSAVPVTQFFFDAAPVIAWEKRLRAEGNRLPVDPGLHGATSVPSLLKHALACGIGASVKALSSHSGGVLQFAQIRTPDKLARDIAAAKAADAGSLFRNFHLFPLGGLARTMSWITDVNAERPSLV